MIQEAHVGLVSSNQRLKIRGKGPGGFRTFFLRGGSYRFGLFEEFFQSQLFSKNYVLQNVRHGAGEGSLSLKL